MIKGHPEISACDVVAYGLVLMVSQYCERPTNHSFVQLSGADGQRNAFQIIKRHRDDPGASVPIEHEYNLSDRKCDVNRRSLAALESIGLVDRDPAHADRFFGKISQAGKALENAIDAIDIASFEEITWASVRAEPTYNSRYDQVVLALLDCVTLYCDENSDSSDETGIQYCSTISCGEWSLEILEALGLMIVSSGSPFGSQLSESAAQFEKDIGAPPRYLRVNRSKSPKISAYVNYEDFWMNYRHNIAPADPDD